MGLNPTATCMEDTLAPLHGTRHLSQSSLLRHAAADVLKDASDCCENRATHLEEATSSHLYLVKFVGKNAMCKPW